MDHDLYAAFPNDEEPSRTSLLMHIHRHAWGDAPGLDADAEQAAPGEGDLPPGARDGLLLLHSPRPDPEGDAFRTEVARREDALVRWLRHGDDSGLGVFDEADTVLYMDALMVRMGELPAEDQVRLYALARQLVRTTARPALLKLATSLLGAFAERTDVPLFVTLARHGEYALFALGALLNTLEDARERIVIMMGLLPHVRGWAKLHLIDHILSAGPDEVQLASLVRDGFSALDGLETYVAPRLARMVDLHALLVDATGRDPWLVDGAGALLTALAAVDHEDDVEGGLLSLGGWDKSLDAYLVAVNDLPLSLARYEAVRTMSEWLGDVGRIAAMRAVPGPGVELVEELRRRVTAYLGGRRWEAPLRAVLERPVAADEDRDIEVAVFAAADHALPDLDDLLLTRLERFPDEFATLQVLTNELAEEAFAAALPRLRRALGLDRLAGAEAPGISGGPPLVADFAALVLAGLARFPRVVGGDDGLGLVVRLTGSDHHDVRIGALRVLWAWAERDALRVRALAATAVITAAQLDPEDGVRHEAVQAAARLGLALPMGEDPVT